MGRQVVFILFLYLLFLVYSHNLDEPIEEYTNLCLGLTHTQDRDSDLD
jgi:hypothetical protein